MKAVLIGVLKGTAVILLTAALLAGTIAGLLTASPQLGLYMSWGVAGIAVILTLLAFSKPVLPAWIAGRIVSVTYLAMAAFAVVTSEQVVSRGGAARLQELRRSDPNAYLAKLKADGDSRWDGEFQVLDPQGYANFTAQRRRAEEEARKAEIAGLLQQLKTVPAGDTATALAMYKRLSALDPSNADYQKQRDSLTKRVAELEQKRQLESEQTNFPERYVTIENFSWSKEGFGSVMEANFAIKNGLPWPIKDIEVRCDHSAPSGTTIDSNDRTIYERIEPGKIKQVSKFNMGFIHSQATRSSCRVIRVVQIR